MDWENHFEKNPIQRIEKTVKIKVKLPQCEQKITSEKANFCWNTVFSLYFKIRTKEFYVENPHAFSLHFLFRRDQNHYSNLLVWTCIPTRENVRTYLSKIAGRSLETPRNGNPFQRHPTTHQTKRASTNLWLSWNKTIKQKSKNKKIKSVKIWFKKSDQILS